MTGIAKSQISRSRAAIDDKVILSPLIESDWSYLWIDWSYLWIDVTLVKVRESRRIAAIPSTSRRPSA